MENQYENNQEGQVSFKSKDIKQLINEADEVYSALNENVAKHVQELTRAVKNSNSFKMRLFNQKLDVLFQLKSQSEQVNSEFKQRLESIQNENSQNYDNNMRELELAENNAERNADEVTKERLDEVRKAISEQERNTRERVNQFAHLLEQ